MSTPSVEQAGRNPDWPAVAPMLRADTDPVLAEACRAAARAAADARAEYDRATLASSQGIGADGTETMLIDRLVEDAVIAVATRHRVNLLSEESGLLDVGSSRTLVVDPLDGSANAAAGVPLSCFSGVILDDSTPTEALTCWLETGRVIQARPGETTSFRTSGAHALAGSALSLLRPKVGEYGDNTGVWTDLTGRAGRVRILSSTCLESMLVADGSIDAFADAGSDTHRLVDLFAALVYVEAAGGYVCDAFGRPIEYSTDLTQRFSGIIAASQQLAEEITEVIATGTVRA